MKNIVFFSFLICLVLIGCRDKNSSKVSDNQSVEQIKEQTLELEKASEDNLEIKNDIEHTVDELDALMKEIDN